MLERRWFASRRCLDIGCNEGLVTLAVAARFGAASMLGVDLDEHLIRNACRQGTLEHCLLATARKCILPVYSSAFIMRLTPCFLCVRLPAVIL